MHPAMTVRGRHLYDRLIAHSGGLANAEPVACMLATRHSGGGALPEGLGLAADEFAHLLAYYFPGAVLPGSDPRPPPRYDPRLLEEKEELSKLMLMYRAGMDAGEVWMSQIVATGCMASEHLWYDLGLWSRPMLSELLARNFPGLAAKNDQDMKWKKFLYKQLCIQEGIYICRAPSCELCTDYPKCFGPEE
jgi:nitrogen fixation protein NifQ